MTENNSILKKNELEVLEKMYQDYSEMTNNIYKIISELYQTKNKS